MGYRGTGKKNGKGMQNWNEGSIVKRNGKKGGKQDWRSGPKQK
tara:strand:- start:364 stop:492 length:129 start_codon:yes stop_codon:yes gene_type:complete